MCLPNMNVWLWRKKQARTRSCNYPMSGKRCWSVSPGLNSKDTNQVVFETPWEEHLDINKNVQNFES